MPSTFPGFSPKAITFLRQLKKNNSRDWFQPRKDAFEELVRQPMLELTGMVADQMRGFAVDYVRDPAKAVHRIYRDVRFSKDKSPYKTNISAMFFRSGLPKNQSAGFYFSISSDGVDVAGGLYMPGPAELLAIRKAIVLDPMQFKDRLENRQLCKVMGECQGESMTRPPKGFDAMDSKAADLVRRKQFYYFVTASPDTATKPGLDQHIVKSFRAMAPVIDFLNQILLAATKESDESQNLPLRPKPMF